MQYLTIRKLVIFGSLLSSLGCILCYFSSHFISLVIFLGIINGKSYIVLNRLRSNIVFKMEIIISLGFGNAIIFILSSIIVDSNFKMYKTTAMGIFRSGASAGAFALPPLMEYLISIYGLKGSFLLFGGILLQGTVAACLYRQPRNTENAQKSEDEGETSWKTLQTNIEVIKDPMFLVIAFTFIMLRLFISIFGNVITDFGIDKGINIQSSVFLVSSFAISDLFGRLGLSWIVDFGFIKRVNIVIICYFSLAVLLCILSLTWNYALMLTITFIIGIFSGCIATQQTILMSENLGVKKLPVAVGLECFLAGLSLLLLDTPITVYFRENLGRYDYLFYFLASLFLLFAILWIMEPLVQKLRNRNNQCVTKL
ncbi:monocarboxylate transporter 2-like isoform X2 [Centruroides sculpturatus]|nr:monocarboxylate transporter 2-like isoform X2 [Centruroides sculpturatus]